MAKMCGTCKWRKYDKSDGWVCTNSDSVYYSDWMEFEYWCEDWEEKPVSKRGKMS